jgi:pyruvate kinase
MFEGIDLTSRILPMHLISVSVEASLEYLKPAAIVVCTDRGGSARRLASFRLPVWIAAVSPNVRTFQNLLFSYGVAPVHESRPPPFWNSYVKDWVRRHQLPGDFAILTQRPSTNDPEQSSNGDHQLVKIGIVGLWHGWLGLRLRPGRERRRPKSFWWT